MQTAVQVPQVQMQPQPLVGEKGYFNAKCVMALGSVQVVTGVLCVILQTVTLVMGSTSAMVGAGIWCGIAFIISGAVGVASISRKTNSFIKTKAFMWLSIISVVFVYLIFKYVTLDVLKDKIEVSKIINSLILGLAFCQLVSAIWSSALWCKANFCYAPRGRGSFWQRWYIRGRNFCLNCSWGGINRNVPQASTVRQQQYIQRRHPQVVFQGQGQALPNEQITVVVQGKEEQLKRVLRVKRPYLVERLNMLDGLPNHLISSGVINIRTKDEIQLNAGKFTQVERLLDYLDQKPYKDIRKFVSALRADGQDHVADIIERGCYNPRVHKSRRYDAGM